MWALVCGSPFGAKLAFYACVVLFSSLRIAAELVGDDNCSELPKLRVAGSSSAFAALAAAQLLWEATIRSVFLVPRRWQLPWLSRVLCVSVLLVFACMAAICALCTLNGCADQRSAGRVQDGGSGGQPKHSDEAAQRQLRRAADAFDVSLACALLLLGGAFLHFGSRMRAYVRDTFPVPEQHASLKARLLHLTRAMLLLMLCFVVRVGFLLALVGGGEPLGRICELAGGGGGAGATAAVRVRVFREPLYYAVNDWLPVCVPVLVLLLLFGRADDVGLLRLHSQLQRRRQPRQLQIHQLESPRSAHELGEALLRDENESEFAPALTGSVNG
eukprot:g6790.t1